MQPRSSNPALRRLDPLVGEWEFEASVAGQVLGRGQATFAWLDGSFLVQHADGDPARSTPEWNDNAPFPVVSIIGLDDAAEMFSMLYADARGVHRIYQITLADGVWTQWRDAFGFHQRFTGRFSADGTTIVGRWERSPDGSSWTPDFDLTYAKRA
jgi:hypothetical protein